MAIIGQQLLQPESGWRRYDDTDSNISYKNNTKDIHGDYWNGSAMMINNGGWARFNFIGTKLRIITYVSPTQSILSLYIDGKFINDFNGVNPSQALLRVLAFDIQNLSNKEHHVVLNFKGDKKMIVLDAIDINENGELKPYNSDKYLLKQNNNYYSINNNYIDLGKIDNNEELDNLIDEYGYNDLSILTRELNSKKIPTRLEKDYYKSFYINLNDIKDNINLIEENDKKYIEYECSSYKISNKIKEINDGKFEVLMKE
ncbi:hypothetical protein EXQ42_10325 [Clostridium botulinum]|nr:hypothetical protein [Clostridium botulinum]MBO0575245.1 hypothetical protein [Clostridium botulinum]